MYNSEFWNYFWGASEWLQDATIFVGKLGAAVGVVLLAGPSILVLQSVNGLIEGILFIREEVRRVTS